MTKPNIALSRWADTGGANLLVPNSGQRDSGFTNGTPAMPGYINELLARHYDWLAFLDPLLTSGGGFIAPVDENMEVSGTGRHAHGDQTVNVPSVSGAGTNWAPDPAGNGDLLSSGAGDWFVGIPTTVGWVITDVTFEVYGDAAADLTGAVRYRPKNATPNPEVSFALANAPVAYTDVPVTIPDWTVADGDVIWVFLSASAGGLRIGSIRVTYHFPPV